MIYYNLLVEALVLAGDEGHEGSMPLIRMLSQAFLSKSTHGFMV